MKSTSKPLSNDDLRKVKEKKNTPEGKLDEKGKPLKFRSHLHDGTYRASFTTSMKNVWDAMC